MLTIAKMGNNKGVDIVVYLSSDYLVEYLNLQQLNNEAVLFLQHLSLLLVEEESLQPSPNWGSSSPSSQWGIRPHLLVGGLLHFCGSLGANWTSLLVPLSFRIVLLQAMQSRQVKCREKSGHLRLDWSTTQMKCPFCLQQTHISLSGSFKPEDLINYWMAIWISLNWAKWGMRVGKDNIIIYYLTFSFKAD